MTRLAELLLITLAAVAVAHTTIPNHHDHTRAEPSRAAAADRRGR